MKTYDKMSFLRGATTLFQGQQINGQTHREEKDKERTQRRERAQKRDRRSDQRRRSKKIQGQEQRNQDRSEKQRQRV
jgi:hypothetical protein